MKRLTVVFPGIGYTAEKPLLYYSRRIAEHFGYESLIIPYTGFPKKVKGDRDKIKKSCQIALIQAKEILDGIDLAAYEDILFIGKSIGTVAAANIASQSPLRNRIRLILYTPLVDTFAVSVKDAIAFTGSADPWVCKEENRIPVLCNQFGIACTVIEGANHSLETSDPRTDIRNLQGIMDRTTAFIREIQIQRITYYETLLQELEAEISKPGVQAGEPVLCGKAEKLAQYYESEDWKLDYADDEAGQLPKNLKRGVLSEDAVYNVLEAFRDLQKENRKTEI